MLEYDKKHCKIYFLRDVQCVHLDWSGFAKSEDFREACNVSLEVLKKHGVRSMIADNSKAKSISDTDEQWMTNDWFPRAIDAGFRVSAVIVGKDVFRAMSVTNIVNKLDKDSFTVQYFDHFFKAKSWLRQMSTKK